MFQSLNLLDRPEVPQQRHNLAIAIAKHLLPHQGITFGPDHIQHPGCKLAQPVYMAKQRRRRGQEVEIPEGGIVFMSVRGGTMHEACTGVGCDVRGVDYR